MTEEDLDADGKVDFIHFHIFDWENKKSRSFSFLLEDKERNIFVEYEDTGWK